jgi:putative DNA primase/helicase
VAVINSGHCRDDPGVPRCVGPDFEVRMFKVWAPLCLALIGFLPSTVSERSITIEMRKRPPGAAVKRLLRQDRDADAHTLARRAARWAVDHMLALERAEPVLPPTLGDRPADNWWALLAIADLIGVGEEARAAAQGLSPADDDAEDRGVQLLADVYDIFSKLRQDVLTSAVIAGELHRLEGRPWIEYGREQRPITTNAIARLLRPFKIRPAGTVRIGANTAKGYARKAFEDTWAAYSIPATPQQPSHRHKSGDPRGSDDSQPSHPGNGVTDGNGLDATESATCDGVTDATTHERENTAPKGRRKRGIKGADTDPGVEGLP